MRHLKLPGQSLGRIASFKTQIGGIFKQLNKFDETEKTEVVSYIQSCLNDPPEDAGPSNNRKVKRVQKRKIKLFNNTVSARKMVFKCKVCECRERTRKLMLKHLQTHVGAPRSCLKCKKTFNGSAAYEWHATYYCSPPGVAAYKYKCSSCPREFVSKRTLESHLQGHKRNNCAYCDKVLTRRRQLVRHLLEEHSIKLERDTYKCDYCEKRYIKKCSLYYHLRQHLPEKCVCLECGKVHDTEEEHQQHKKEHDLQKHFTCSTCGDKFSRRQQYLWHLKRHNQYKCVTCKESYASRYKAVKHKQEGHEVEGLRPRFLCPHCPVAFHRESRFHLHMRKHTEESRSVNCKYCKKTFNSPFAYYKHCITINHEKFSPEINDIACNKCGKHFAKRYDLRQHMYRAHNVSKQFVSCEHCSYRTVHKCNMDRHVALHFRTESQYTCEYCGKNCYSIASLNDHITYNHVQTKQFKCDKCDKSFKRNSELVRHQDSHSDERPHVCGLCNKAYKRVNHLKRHQQQAHQVAKDSRRIKKVDVVEPQKQVGEDVAVSTDLAGATEEQLGYFLTGRKWSLDGEDLGGAYGDVSLGS